MSFRFGEFKDWAPVISKVVWPIFIVVMLVIFGGEIKRLYNLLLKEVEKGRSLEIADIIRLGERAKATTITELSVESMPIEAIGGAGAVAEKSTYEFLHKLKDRLRSSPLQRIDVLLVTDGKRYSSELLKEYISSLGIRFIVFTKRQYFDGWIDAGIFTGQLRPRTTYSYPKLKSEIVGISSEHVRPNVSAKQVLEKMQVLHIDSIPVVDAQGKFMFFSNRGEILAKLIATMILEEKTPE